MLAKQQILIIVSIIVLTCNLPGVASIPDGAKGIEVSGGEDHSLVLTASNAVWGCGHNGSYQLGIGNNSSQRTLARVLEGEMVTPSDYLEDINDMDAGWMHSVALDVNGLVWAWGWNSEGQLGNGKSGSGQYEATAVQVLSGAQDPNDQNSPLKYIEFISAGRSGEHSLATDANGFVWAWGKNNMGQLGNGQSGGNASTPVQVVGVGGQGNIENMVAVSGGEEHSMGLEKLDANDANCNGRVYTWGDNECFYGIDWGKLGDGSSVAKSTTAVIVLSGAQDPCQTEPLKNIVAISAGWDHCMTLEKRDPCDANCNGRVYTWGCNGAGWDSAGGRLGNATIGHPNSSSTPVMVLSGQQDPCATEPLKDIIAISSGEGHCLALDSNNCVWAWGSNKHGQLGNGQFDSDDSDPCTTPIKVVGPDGEGYLEGIVAIDAGFWHSLAVDSNGTVWTWGKGSDGRLGLGDEVSRNTPHPIPIVRNITQGTAYFRIQAAIDDANNGDELEASLGRFAESVDFLTKEITPLRSTDPNDPNVVADTIIDGGVTFNNNPNSVISGFTITGASKGVECKNNSSPQIGRCIIEENSDYGVSCDSSSPVITDCTIKDNYDRGVHCTSSSSPTIADCSITGNGSSWPDAGIYCSSSDPNVGRCVIKGNYYGMYCTGSSSATVTNCEVMDNGLHGICFEDNTSPSVMKNNMVHNNEGDGICLDYTSSGLLVRNNTIVDNASYGIDADGASDANVINCILWGNHDGSFNSSGTYDVTYCCIEDCNEASGTGNICGDGNDPNFKDPDANDFHLGPNSPCIEAGDPNGSYNGETDIDGEPRVADGDCDSNDIVDMGADEVYWPDCWGCLTQCHGDADCTGEVDFGDLGILKVAFFTEYGDPNYNPCADFDREGHVNFADLGILKQYIFTSPDPNCMCGETWPP